MKTIFAFLGGALAGAAAALLMAPDKGRDTRKKIHHMFDRHIDMLEEEIQTARMKADKAAREAIQDVAAAAKKA